MMTRVIVEVVPIGRSPWDTTEHYTYINSLTLADEFMVHVPVEALQEHPR